MQRYFGVFTLIGAKASCIRFNKVDKFIRVYDGFSIFSIIW